MGFSMRLSVILVVSIMNLDCIPLCSSHLLNSSSSLRKVKDMSFTARLIHRSSPESPFYDPNATPLDLMRASMRTTLARASYFSWKKNFSLISKKYASSPVDLINTEYVMRYSIGTPPVETYAVPDTGGSLTWLQCNCINCYEQRVPVFDPNISSSYQSIPCVSKVCKDIIQNPTSCNSSDPVCRYRLTNRDYSYSAGHVATETLTLQDSYQGHGNYTLFNILFGCGENNEDSSGQNIPGVVGLSNLSYSIVRQLGLSEFSYCISSNVSKDNSKIRFGLPAAMISGGFTTALTPNDWGLYIFKDVDGIYVDGEKIDAPEELFQFNKTGGNGGLLIDTGSTYTHLSSSAFDALIKKIKDNMPPDMEAKGDGIWDLCYDKKYRPNVLLPEIEFRFKGDEKTFPLSNKNAWIDNPFEQFCLAIARSSEDALLHYTLSAIGMYQLRDVNVVIDLKQDQVSFMYDFDC